MEHFYQTISSENWFNYPDVYSMMVEKYGDGSHFVEVGTWKGQSACFMAVEIINSEKNIVFDCVDTWEYVQTSSEIPKRDFENLYEIFLENILPVKDYINIVKGISWEASSKYDDNSLDFIFIDAAHDYYSVTKDLNSWFPKLKKGGTIAGHDYYPGLGVYPAVNDFFKDKTKLKTTESCWIYEI